HQLARPPGGSYQPMNPMTADDPEPSTPRPVARLRRSPDRGESFDLRQVIGACQLLGGDRRAIRRRRRAKIAQPLPMVLPASARATRPAAESQCPAAKRSAGRWWRGSAGWSDDDRVRQFLTTGQPAVSRLDVRFNEPAPFLQPIFVAR